MRLVEVIAVLLPLAGCNAAFGLKEQHPPDAPPPDAPPPDAPPIGVLGCADGTRDLFLDIVKYPEIAGCAGSWKVMGLLAARTGSPCSATHDCSAADLCAPGWGICGTTSAVKERTETCEDQTEHFTATPGFYAAAIHSAGQAMCDDASPGNNDLFGCDAPFPRNSMVANCGVIDATSGDVCLKLMGQAWICPDGFNELTTVRKAMDLDGGVLCCKL